jgi:hypothetical protein
VTLDEFRKLVRKRFGGDLRRLTPENVREFLDQVQPQLNGGSGLDRRILLNEPERSYEGIVRDFLAQSLEMPSDQAVIALWLHCLELWVAGVTDIEAERLQALFAPIPGDSGQ